MILPDFKIRQWAEMGGVDPFNADHVNLASIDLTLGNKISVPRWYWSPLIRLIAWYALRKPDPKEKPHLYWDPPKIFKRYTLWPGQFVLCHSVETTAIPDSLASLLLSKSSVGRIGLEHLHAGFGDPGFGSGDPAQWTWELVNLAPWPIELVADERLTQLILLRMEEPPEQSYAVVGRYQGQRGPTVARIETAYKDGKVAIK